MWPSSLHCDNHRLAGQARAERTTAASLKSTSGLGGKNLPACFAGQMEQAGIQAGIPVQVKKQSPARLRFQVSYKPYKST